MSTPTVAVLRGGPSSEYDVSITSGAEVLAALQKRGYNVRDIIVTRGGDWLQEGFVRQPDRALIGVDVVFIAMHGAYGEDGTVQRILDRLCIPYTGSTAYPSSVAMHKQLTKEYLKQHEGIKMPRYMRLRKERVDDVAMAADNIRQLFGPEYVIKPIASGSSVGVTIVPTNSSLAGAIEGAFADNDDILVEERIAGTEATVGILENFRGQRYYDLPVIEIVPPSYASFFSQDVKYNGDTDEICPGRFNRSIKQRLAEMARTVHQELGLRHYSRSDFMLRGDDIYFLEVNTLPGLTAGSLFPKAVEAVGSSYEELVTHLVGQALQRV